MTWHDYQESKSYGDGDPSFYALIMAAMRRADSSNARKLREAFPGVIVEGGSCEWDVERVVEVEA